MTSRSARASAMFVALAATTAACLLAPAPAASAATTIETAAPVLGFAANWVTELPGSGDITSALATAAKVEGTASRAHVIHLPIGSVTVSAIVRPANYVYLVAERGTRVTWRGASTNLLRFASETGRVNGGVYGGTWDGDGRGRTNLIHLGNASVSLAELTVTDAGQNGIGVYARSSLTVHNVTATDNEAAGVYVAESSRLTASGLRSTNNQRNGVQLASGSTGTITGSFLDRNGQAVRGSTTGKTGHGLGVAKATVVVSGTSISSNKVCGVSITDDAVASISGSYLDDNGRHGLGTVPGTTATIADSTANNNGYNGVLASGKGTLVTLERVTINSAARSGLSVPSGGTAKVTGSTIAGSRHYDISVSAKGNLFLLGNNTIKTSRRHGITVSGRSKILISGAGNQVIGSRGDGLRITGSGTTGRITESAAFLNNRNSGIVVVSKAKLQMVKTCVYSGKNKLVQTRSRGKVSYF